jgi:serine protease Do
VIKDYGSATKAPAVATTIIIKFKQGDEVAASLEAIDQFNDLAILKVDPSQVHGFVYAALGDSDQVLTGAEVLALGAPFGFDWTMTTGNVSYAHRLVDSRINSSWKIPDAIQHDAPVNTGNSGGPLFNARGEVIGINQQIASPSKTDSGVSFAVSSNIVKRALNVWRSTGAKSIQYADLGLTTRTLSPQVAAQEGLKVSAGALIQTAVGPAAQAGLATGPTTTYLHDAIVIGDVVTELAGQKITSNEDLLRVAAAIPADAPVEIGFTRRDGSKQTATIDPTPRAIV